MDTRRIRHNNNMLARTSKRHLFTIFSTLWLLPQRALATSASAATTTTTTTSALTSSQLASQMLLLFHSTLRWIKAEKRTIVTTAVSIFILRTTVKWIRCKRRQALDATSEWGRYAKHPGARGRALLTLALFKVLPLWILSKVVPNNRFRQRILKFSGRLFARGLIQLGALYIKLGQIVSSREDLLPIEWLAAMECLQDQVPAKSGQDALDLAYSAWPAGADDFERTFRDFETTPLAAASLGQVHKAVINIGPNEGDVVAIKLQRPFLREIYDQDLSLLTKVAAAVDKFGGKSGNLGGVSQSWTDIFQDAEEILYREIDYRDEAANGKRFCDDFGLTKGGGKSKRTTAFSRDGKPLPSAASWLRAPYVYDDLSSEKVLVMEFVPSIKINNYAKLAAANVTMEQREYLADCLGRAYLRQFCCNRFFSTDPHAGECAVLDGVRPFAHAPVYVVVFFIIFEGTTAQTTRFC
jgi:predicted unusual protein kinase regulating ubiquinone biosynthesis (AarF/ABC1/UbiB family)